MPAKKKSSKKSNYCMARTAQSLIVMMPIVSRVENHEDTGRYYVYEYSAGSGSAIGVDKKRSVALDQIKVLCPDHMQFLKKRYRSLSRLIKFLESDGYELVDEAQLPEPNNRLLRVELKFRSA